MATIHKIDSPFALAQARIIRRQESSSAELNRALRALGGEVAKRIVEEFYLHEQTVTTPMQIRVDVALPRIPLAVAITTREDMEHFAAGLRPVLDNCELGWMDFEGRRGLQALHSPVRRVRFPRLRGQQVDSVIVAKATLASGCTAVSLAQAAYSRYMPARLIIASIFYTNRGLELLEGEFRNAHIFVVGEPDSITDDGLLVPGIGLLAERTGGGDGAQERGRQGGTLSSL